MRKLNEEEQVAGGYVDKSLYLIDRGGVLVAGEPQPGEKAYHITACNHYLLMGPKRSLSALATLYLRVAKLIKAGDATLPTPPTTKLRSLGDWSTRFNWQARLELYNQQVETEIQRERRAVLRSFIAMDYIRVQELFKLHKALSFPINAYIAEQEQLAKGLSLTYLNENGETKVRRPMACPLGEIRELRGVLDDLARETGGRTGLPADLDPHQAGYTADDLQGAIADVEGFEDELASGWLFDGARGQEEIRSEARAHKTVHWKYQQEV